MHARFPDACLHNYDCRNVVYRTTKCTYAVRVETRGVAGEMVCRLGLLALMVSKEFH